MLAVLVDGANPWAENKSKDDDHACYFCRPHLYPAMPAHHTLCARCGHLIRTREDDRLNRAMAICPGCEDDLAMDEMA